MSPFAASGNCPKYSLLLFTFFSFPILNLKYAWCFFSLIIIVTLGELGRDKEGEERRRRRRPCPSATPRLRLHAWSPPTTWVAMPRMDPALTTGGISRPLSAPTSHSRTSSPQVPTASRLPHSLALPSSCSF